MTEFERDPRGTLAPRRLHYIVNRFSRALNRAAENTALAQGISLPQLIILEVLGEGVPLSNAQIARRTFVSSQATHVVLNSMLKLDLLRPAAHPTNRRVRLWKLSEEGWRVLAVCSEEMNELERQLAERTGTGDAAGTASLTDIFEDAADTLAGGYFGDKEAEALAIARRQPNSKYAGRPVKNAD